MPTHSQKFPIKITMNVDLLDEFRHAEMPHWEDFHTLEGEVTEEGKSEEPFAFDILQRWRSQIEMRNPAEVAEIYYSACSGTFQLHHTRAAQTLVDTLIPYMRYFSEREVLSDKAQWWWELQSYPTGH
jgi:hypothetical protein